MKLEKYIYPFVASAVIMFGTQSCFQDMDDDPSFNYPPTTVNPEPPTPTVTDPSSIATSNLVAYFPFDGNGIEQINTLGPKAEPKTQYVTGKRGLAWKGVDNSYFLYDLPADSKLRTMKAFTISMWLNNAKIPASQAPVPIIFQLSNSDDLFWGNITVSLDRTNEDMLRFKNTIRKEGAEWANQTIAYNNKAFTTDEWIHVIFSYDNVTSTYNTYINGKKIDTGSSVTDRFSGPKGSNGQQLPLGDLNFVKADQINLGAWLPKALNGANDEWMGWFNGEMDELRIYDKGLSATEVKSLYDAEVQNTGKAFSDPGAIAKNNLVAYFPFDNNGAEKIAGLAPKLQPNVTYTKGQRGLAWQGVNNSYFLYDLPADSKLRTMKAFTISMWLNNAKIPASQAPVPIIFQLSNSDDLFWGNITVSLDRTNEDMLRFKNTIRKAGAEWANQTIAYNNKAFTTDEWMHVIFSYDNVTSTYNTYINGKKIDTGSSVTDRFSGPKGSDGQQLPLGDLNFVKADQINLGTWLPKALNGANDEWMGWFNGKLDEFRIYDKALSVDDVTSLYNAEVKCLNK